jgi:hypothetical protein
VVVQQFPLLYGIYRKRKVYGLKDGSENMQHFNTQTCTHAFIPLDLSRKSISYALVLWRLTGGAMMLSSVVASLAVLSF